jgi:selenocysteine-specific elongation factor
MLLAAPETITPTRLAGVRFRHLPDSPRPLLHHTEVKLFVGSAETVAHVRLLEGDALAPGETGWLQLDLRDPLPLQRGDRFILRLPSPAVTLGGGTVIDATPSTRWRRNRPEIIARLESMLRGTPEDLLVQALDATAQPLTVTELATATGLDRDTIQQAVVILLRNGRVVAINAEMLISGAVLATLTERLTRIVTGFHKANPLRRGMKVGNAAQQLAISPVSLTLLAEGGHLRSITATPLHGTVNGLVILSAATHQPQPSKAQKQAIELLSSRFAAAPYTPPSVKESTDLVGAEVLEALVENGDLRQLNSDVLFTERVFTEMIAATREMLETDGKVNVRSLRDRFETSRKYALAVLEYLNSLGLTKRQGDDHVLGTAAWERLG